MDFQDIFFIDRALMEAVAWAVVHSLWQGLVAFLLLAVALKTIKKQQANLRYNVALAAMFGMAFMFLLTFFSFYQSAKANQSATEVFSYILPNTVSESTEKDFWLYYNSFTNFLQAHLSHITMAWAVGVLMFSLRFAVGLWYAQRLKQVQTRPVVERAEQVLSRLCLRLKVREKVRLLESALVKTPVVIGWLKPVILFPLGMIIALPPHELESILAHELAHIRRNDYAVNLLKSLIEIVLFYHPATWWIAAQIDAERENACDDLALAATGDAQSYLYALARVVEFQAKPALVMAATGGNVLSRMKRIVATQHLGWATRNSAQNRFPAALLALTFLLFLGESAKATQFIQEQKQEAKRILVEINETLQEFPMFKDQQDIEIITEEILVKKAKTNKKDNRTDKDKAENKVEMDTLMYANNHFRVFFGDSTAANNVFMFKHIENDAQTFWRSSPNDKTVSINTWLDNKENKRFENEKNIKIIDTDSMRTTIFSNLLSGKSFKINSLDSLKTIDQAINSTHSFRFFVNTEDNKHSFYFFKDADSLNKVFIDGKILKIANTQTGGELMGKIYSELSLRDSSLTGQQFNIELRKDHKIIRIASLKNLENKIVVKIKKE